MARRPRKRPGFPAVADDERRKLLGDGLGFGRFRQRLQGDGPHTGLRARTRDPFGGRPLLDRTRRRPLFRLRQPFAPPHRGGRQLGRFGKGPRHAVVVHGSLRRGRREPQGRTRLCLVFRGGLPVHGEDRRHEGRRGHGSQERRRDLPHRRPRVLRAERLPQCRKIMDHQRDGFDVGRRFHQPDLESGPGRR